MTTAGGITVAMIASRITPPAAPVNTAMKAVTNDAADRPSSKSGPMSGVTDKSIPLLLLWGDSAPVESAAPATQETPPADAPVVEQEIRGRLSAKRHQEILTRQREKQAAEHATAVKALQDQIAAFQHPELRAKLQMLDLAEQDPDAFAKTLLSHPTFASRLTLKQQAEAQAEKPNGRKDLGEMP